MAPERCTRGNQFFNLLKRGNCHDLDWEFNLLADLDEWKIDRCGILNDESIVKDLEN